MLCFMGCLGDPVGPAGTLILRRVSPLDSVLIGAPGRALLTPITFQALDGSGQPVAGAVVSWTALGTNAKVVEATTRTDATGQISAQWMLGTVASEKQTLAVRIQIDRRVAADTMEATATPSEISSIGVGQGDTATVKLGVATLLVPQATDPFGNHFVPAAVRFVSLDTTLCTIDSLGVVQPRRRGFGRVAILTAAAADTVVVHSTQVAQAVVTSPDTVVFYSLGQTATINAQLLDDQGQYILDSTPPVTDLQVADTAVAEPINSGALRAHGDGITSASFSVDGLSGQVVLLVRQVPATLTASVAVGTPVVTLPVGATLPLSCRAFDGNGFPIAQDPTLVGSVRGTVTGTRCSNARIQRSGYDTLLFALGSAQTRVPVIIATAPDSIGVIATARLLTTVERNRFVGENLANPSILALRPLVAGVFAAYGNPTTNLDRARALRDWVARTAVHPYAPLHPDGSTSNLSVLSSGTSWADVNLASMAKIDEDANYWGGVGMNGYAMLDRLLGTLDPVTGQRADDGMMTLVEGARYRIRDVASYHYVLCSYQDIILNALWAAAGLQGMLISTIGHDPAAVFIPELGRWVYEDPEWDEEYLLDGAGEPLSPADLLALSSAGQGWRLHAAKLNGPSFDPETYVANGTYTNEGHSDGFRIMGSQLYNSVVETVAAGSGSWPVRYVQIDVPQLAFAPEPFNDPVQYARVTADEAFPTLGVVVQGSQVEDSVFVVSLSSTFPNYTHFERRANGGPWTPVSDVDVLPVGACTIEYRSVDSAGNTSAGAVLNVWAPRAEEFLQVSDSGGFRQQTSLCIETSP